MSRSTHDIECQITKGGCGYKGKVVDDSIVCPKCGRSVEGRAITGDELEAMLVRIRARKLAQGEVAQNSSENKEARS